MNKVNTLAAQLETVRGLNEQKDKEAVALRRERDQFRTGYDEARKETTEVRFQFADMKQRLLSAELANEFMRGYLARVAEDDVVREELIQTGDLEAPTLVPKRKSHPHPRPDHFTYPSNRQLEGGAGFIHHGYDEERRRKARHWVNY